MSKGKLPYANTEIKWISYFIWGISMSLRAFVLRFKIS